MRGPELVAERLLLRHLDDGQRAHYAESGTFFVRGTTTGDQYLVAPARILCFRDDSVRGKVVESLCVFPSDVQYIPSADRMLAMKLWLEADEMHVRRTAGRHFITGGECKCHLCRPTLPSFVRNLFT
jgi:hypothetical protein